MIRQYRMHDFLDLAARSRMRLRLCEKDWGVPEYNFVLNKLNSRTLEFEVLPGFEFLSNYSVQISTSHWDQADFVDVVVRDPEGFFRIFGDLGRQNGNFMNLVRAYGDRSVRDRFIRSNSSDGGFPLGVFYRLWNRFRFQGIAI